MHDCIVSTIPIFCFSFHGPHGHSELHNSTLADAHCSDTAASPGIQFVLRVMLVAVNRGKAPVHLDSRWGCGPQDVSAWMHWAAGRGVRGALHGCCHPATERLPSMQGVNKAVPQTAVLVSNGAQDVSAASCTTMSTP